MKAKWNGFRIRKSRKTVFQKFPYEESSQGESIDTKIKLEKRTRDKKCFKLSYPHPQVSKDIFMVRRSKSEGGIGFTPEKRRKAKKIDTIQTQAPKTPLEILMKKKKQKRKIKEISDFEMDLASFAKSRQSLLSKGLNKSFQKKISTVSAANQTHGSFQSQKRSGWHHRHRNYTVALCQDIKDEFSGHPSPLLKSPCKESEPNKP
ncbi:unnamed protein product [Moneuplotes crassus]|uniref:Uncharacterized protein n=1 Tax=Euplotes crassus TaxID=5936 RepID=A0AAD2DBW6_EUPCR|nr:unnamed protein product [Moneuplotes crassus]